MRNLKYIDKNKLKIIWNKKLYNNKVKLINKTSKKSNKQ